MSNDEIPSSYTLVSVDELREKIKNSKQIKVVLKDSQAAPILERGGYKVEEKIVLNANGSAFFGTDGEAPKLNFGAIMPGSNVFIPKNNRSAFYKYFVEHKKKPA